MHTNVHTRLSPLLTCTCFLKLPETLVQQCQTRWMLTRLWNLARGYAQGKVGTPTGILSAPMWKVEITKGVLNITSTHWGRSLFIHGRDNFSPPGVWWPKFINVCSGWCSSVNWAPAYELKVWWFIPCQGTCLGCGPVMQEATDWCFSHTSMFFLSHFLSPFLSLWK